MPQTQGGTAGKYSVWFVLVVAGFVTCIVTANIIAVKLIDVFG